MNMSNRDHHRRNRPQNNTLVSKCGDIRIRANAQQLIEKYNALALDADDGAARENFLQHAEHYQRMQNEKATSYAQ